MTRQGKIRNATYYIVARAIKFGFDTQYLLAECHLTQKIIKDLSLQNENSFIFQNLLLVVGNLTSTKFESDAIVDLIGNNYEVIIEQIYETKDRDRRVSLLKVLVNLILKASDELSSNSQLFKKVFEIATDERSDESMVENVLWFATSLCEESVFNQHFNLIIFNMLDNNIIGIICNSLESKQERIILQALKLLTKLADVDDFRPELFVSSSVFQRLKAISL